MFSIALQSPRFAAPVPLGGFVIRAVVRICLGSIGADKSG